jgi:hypothetical protein
MFVHWKIRGAWRAYKDVPHRNPGRSFSAVLIRSESVDGELQQRVVASLGYIEEDFLDSKARQLSFWEGVDRYLNALALSPGERQRIEEQLRDVVARPTPEEVTKDKREVRDRLLRLMGRW